MAAVEENTPLLTLPLPHQNNQLADDVQRLRDALNLLDTFVDGKASSSSINAHIADVANPHNTTAAQAGAITDSPDAVTDNHIGIRTADSAQVPSGSSGSITQWVNWLTNRIKTLTGEVNWYDTPPQTLADATAHAADTANPHGTTAAQVGAISTVADSVTDSNIGSRTADPAQVPSGNSGTLTQWINWLANRVKAITGTTNWYDSPATTLAAASSHAADTTNPHGTTATQAGALPVVGGSMTGPIAMNDNAISGAKSVGFNAEYDNGDSGTSKTISLVNSQKQTIKLTGDSTLTISTAGATVGNYLIRIRQDLTGNRLITWSGLSSSRWLGAASAPDINLPPDSETMLSIYFDGVNMIQAITKVGAI